MLIRAGFALLLLAAVPLAATIDGGGGGGDHPYLKKKLTAARRHLDEGDLRAAREAVEKALERDDRHLGALRLWAHVARAQADRDTAAYALHQWLQVVHAAADSPVPRSERHAVEEQLEALDGSWRAFRSLTEEYIEDLADLEEKHARRDRLHSAISLLEEILHIDPGHRGAQERIEEIRRTGGADVATEDIYAGTDPLAGADSEFIEEFNRKHGEWENRASKETENYRINTDAGYLVLHTAGIAMEQMNQAYRQFFRYKLDGDPTPRIDVNIFKTRDEYLALGQGPPVEWSGGHFTGSAVETYVSGGGGDQTRSTDSIKGMYQTLFHEAAHQFVSLTGRGGVPGWLNEAYASFFEGTDILSNGSVRWNRVNNGRLFALAPRLEEGWMADHADGVRDEDGEWTTPEEAPTLRILIENQYQWGPPWYAPTWGVVFFLYNYRDEDTGVAVYRDPLHAYYMSGAGHVGLDQRVQHFEEIVLAGRHSPVRTVDELSEVWRDWILGLRDIQLGQGETRKSARDYGDAALARDEIELAAELYEEAWLQEPDDPEVLWKLARVLQELDQDDRAAAMYRAFARELELRGSADGDERYPEATRLMRELDPLYRRHRQLKEQLEEEGLALARSYRDRGMPLMAMEIARRMSASWSMPGALEFYAEVARETGRSLARWKIAYNEFDLEGWQPNDSYRAYGRMIEAVVENDPTVATEDGSFQTQELAADVQFEGDFSLEAEMRFGDDPGMKGLCFGRKDGSNTHAVVIHPNGSLDVSTKHGGSWTVRDHLQMPEREGEWVKLRIDVVTQEGGDAVVDVYVDDLYLRSVTMPRDSVRGAFGLITGTGQAYYRNVRLLSRDPHDPAARIERELALQERMENEELRVPGVFQGFEPPPLEGGEWLQGDPVRLEDCRGSVVLVTFWTPYQDRVIPTSDYYSWLAQEYGDLGVKVVSVVSNDTSKYEVLEWLADHPLEGVSVLYDDQYTIYPAYHLGDGGWEIPRILIVDVDGRVVWEGDPNLSMNVGWTHEQPLETPVDRQLEELIARRRLRRIAELAPQLKEARAAFGDGKLGRAYALLRPLADTGADWHPQVAAAAELLNRIEVSVNEIPKLARRAEEAGRPLRAHALLSAVVEEFPGGVGDLALGQREALEDSRLYRDARRAWGRLEDAAAAARRGREASELLPDLDRAAELSDCTEVREALKRMKDALFLDGPAALALAFEELEAGLSEDPAFTASPEPSR